MKHLPVDRIKIAMPFVRNRYKYKGEAISKQL
jgi:EAL domain-containing protein (putative c-di-GMP-specific phosphodiesterase class I)